MTTPDDDLRSRLHGAAESIDPGDPPIDRIRAIARRRNLASRAGAVVGVLGLVSAGIVAVVVAGGSDDPGTLRTADPDVTESTTVPASTVAVDDTVPATLPESNAPRVTVEVVQRPGMTGQPAGVGGAPQYGEWSVPWRDGFLVGAQGYAPQPLPDELPEDVIALFPPEVVELFDGELPSTIDEATDMLSDAGLLDLVSDILAANPDAYDAIYSAAVDDAEPTLDVRFTTDGANWEPIEMTLPPGATYLSGVVGSEQRLAIAYSTVNPMTGTNPDGVVRVATTMDLENWEVQEVVAPAPPVTFPRGVDWSSEVAGFAANESGWALGTVTAAQVNPEGLLPADVLAELAENDAGYGTSIDDSGVTIDRMVGTENVTERFTWEELGVEPDVVPYLEGVRYEVTRWASIWGSEATRSSTEARDDIGYGQIAATAAGFYWFGERVEFSPDGLSWATVDLPVDDAYISGLFTFDDGAVVLVSDLRGGGELYRLDAGETSATVLDVPGLPANIRGIGIPLTSEVLVLDATDPGPPPPPFVVEYDGHRLSVDNEHLTLEVVDLATGNTVGTADLADFGQEPDGNVRLDDDGVTVTDSATGDVIVVFPNDVLEAAADEQYPDEDEMQFESDTWMLASRDGERFLLVDLDDRSDRESYTVTAAASNGSNVLVQFDDEWAVYDLP